jgi:hypothetical protein
MTKRIAVLSCCLALVQGSVAAQDIPQARHALLTAAAVAAAPQAGPLRKASLNIDSHRILRAETRRAVRSIQDGCRESGPWMERHPVWAGALVGFGAGFLLTYAVTHDSDEGEFIKIMSPAAGATFWGSVSAGVGALAGWGIGRNRDDAATGGTPCR